METTFTPHELEVFARVVDRAGIDGVPAETIDQLADAALDLDIHPIVAQVARDADEPRVARERATLRLVARLLGRRPAEADDDEFCLA